MDRNQFLKTCGAACLGGAAFTLLLQSCATTTHFVQPTISNNMLVLKKAEFLKVEKGKTVKRKYVLVKTEKYSFPICIYKLKGDNYSALLLECTHKGCELLPQGDFLVCPCHGSEFTNTGVVQNPPAEQNLLSFKITTDNENLYLQL